MLYVPSLSPSQRLFHAAHKMRTSRFLPPKKNEETNDQAAQQIVIDELPVQSEAQNKVLMPNNKVSYIIKTVATYHSKSVKEILAHNRSSQKLMARYDAMYVVRVITNKSLPEIGRRFGGRDHTTVLNAINRTSERISKSWEARSYLGEIIERCMKEIST